MPSWDDLLRRRARLAQAAPEATAIGKLTRDALVKSGDWEALHERTTVYKTTVNEVANDVKVGAVDAGIVFDAVLHDYDTLEAVALPELKPVEANVAAAVLKIEPSTAAGACTSRATWRPATRGWSRYREFGFEPVEGDAWSEQPEVDALRRLDAAAGDRADDHRPSKSAKASACLRVYNGCGILVAQMKAGQVPDAYFACDVEFMKQVQDLFPELAATFRRTSW